MSPSKLSDQPFKISTATTVYPLKEQKAYAVAVPDWERLKRVAKRLVPSIRLVGALWPAGLGVAGSGAFSYFAMHPDFQPTWVRPTVGNATLLLLLLSALVFWLDQRERANVQSSVDGLLEEMKAIEDRCDQGTDA